MATESRTALMALALLLLPCIVMGSSRDLLVRASSSARSDDGTSTAISKASSKVQTETRNAVANTITTALSKARGSSFGEVETIAYAAAEAIGTAIAKAVASVIGEVVVEGSGSACASGEATATAEATVYAKAFAQAVAEATKGENEADANAVAQKIQSGTAQAYADARGEACTRGGSVTFSQQVIAKATIRVYALAVAEAIAYVTDHDAKALSEAISEGGILDEDVQVTGKGNVVVDGDGIGNVDGDGGAETFSNAVPAPKKPVIPECKDTSYARTCCKQRKVERGRCNCDRGRCFIVPHPYSDIPLFQFQTRSQTLQCQCSFVQPRGKRNRNRRG